MKIVVEDWRGVHQIVLPLEEVPYQGVFDSQGKQIMKYYDQTGKEDWLINPKEIINTLYKVSV